MSRHPKGFTLIELVVAIAIIGILTGIAVSSFRSRPYEFQAAVSAFVSDVRLARTLAQSRGAHYQLRFVDASTYVIERMRLEADGTWSPDGTDRRMKTLPPDMAFNRGRATRLEFDTRGTLLNAGLRDWIFIADRRAGVNKRVQYYPSGQVYVW